MTAGRSLLTIMLSLMLFVSFSVGTLTSELPTINLTSGPLPMCNGMYDLTCGGRVFYINAVHHVASFYNPNTATILRNAVRYVSPYTSGQIEVLIFANANDRAEAILDVLSGEPDIAPVKTTNQNDLLSLDLYDVVIVQSNGFDFSTSVEQSIADFRNRGGGVIGGHDVIWSELNNPVLNEIFGATAHGDGSTPGIGWFKGKVTVLKPIEHLITVGTENSWELGQSGPSGEEYFFDMIFTRRMVVVLETNHSGNMTPIAWTLHFPRIDSPVNLTAEVQGNDIRLEWDSPNSTNVAYHIVYRSETPNGFDFGKPLHNSSGDTNPKLEVYTDMGAASPGSPREYYYIVQAVNHYEIRSATSLTVGKWTKHFNQGLNAFSLPLRPLEEKNISWLAYEIPAVKRVGWLNASGNWVRFYPLNPNPSHDTVASQGSTYELVANHATSYTFVGYPGNMIRFMERLGNGSAFRASLSLQVQGNDVVLSWESVPGATAYNIFRSTSREDIYDLGSGPILKTDMTWSVDLDILNGYLGELYYTVIPEDDHCGYGSSTYSKGLVKKEFRRGVHSFALEFAPHEEHTLDWYTSNIQGVEGIAYVIKSVWKFHYWLMPENVYDTVATLSEGYQISIKVDSTTHIFLGG